MVAVESWLSLAEVEREFHSMVRGVSALVAVIHESRLELRVPRASPDNAAGAIASLATAPAHLLEGPPSETHKSMFGFSLLFFDGSLR